LRRSRRELSKFLTKPFTDEALPGAIRQAIERSRETLGRERETQPLRDNCASLSPREQEVMALVVTRMLNKWPASWESAKLQLRRIADE
jgi:FixJ family two-component response regulator